LAPCIPPLWARGGHAQTILGHLLPSPALKAPTETFNVELDDGDAPVVQHIAGRGPLVVSVFHGLGGSTDAKYMVRTANLCAELGHPVFLANHRGAGAGYGKARKPYHSGSAEDLAAVLRLTRRRYPGRRHLAIGF